MHVEIFDAARVRSCVSMADAIESVAAAFESFGRSDFDMPTRVSLGEGKFLVMSAHHRPSGSAIVKTLSLNFDRVPAIAGTVVWNEGQTTRQLVADASAVTTLRTGAVTGVATDLMSDPRSTRLTMIGAGGQSMDQIRAVLAVRPISAVTIVDMDAARADELAGHVQDQNPGLNVRVLADADEAVRDAHIVCCATTSREPLFDTSALPERVHINAIGAFRPEMRELPDDLFAKASTVVVDELEAALEESGEVISAVRSRAIHVEDLVELSSALIQPRPFGDVTVFKSVGIAVQDWAVAHLLATGGAIARAEGPSSRKYAGSR